MHEDGRRVAAVDNLKTLIRAAKDEELLAVVLHQSFKPTAYDVARAEKTEGQPSFALIG